MTLRQYLTIMFISTVLCWVAWGVVLFNIDPFQSGGFGFIFFYVTLFFSVLGITSMIFFLLYRFFSRDLLPMFRYVKKSFRDACLVALTVVGLLFLQGNRLLNRWNLGALILIIILLLSLWFSTRRQESKPLVTNQPPF